ncbi:MAG: peptidoglycan-binding protein [Candidatus Pacebacteria bacterium]|nr:peptidoglycan-binding protein [Candidatus Paceibacterota bacterium]
MTHTKKLSLVTSIALLVLIPGALFAATAFLETPNPDKNKVVFDDHPIAFVANDDTIYLGGSFTSVSQYVGEGVPLSTATGLPVDDFAVFETEGGGGDDSTVYAAVPDGSGGWYVGGSFTHVNDTAWPRLAHVTADGELDTDFDPDVNGSVFALALSSDNQTLYAGGDFIQVNGDVARSKIAAFDAPDGTVIPGFDPDIDSNVTALALSSDGETLYAGGSFEEVNGGTLRNAVAAFSTANGVATAFNPNVNGSVLAIELSSDESTVYIGGVFSCIGTFDEECLGSERAFIAGIDTTSSLATAFDPNPDARVETLDLSADDATLFAGGLFGTVNGATTRNYLAAFSTADGIATSFDPALDARVNSIVLADDGESIYAGGELTSVNDGGATRQYIGEFAVDDGTVTAFDPALGAAVYTLALADSTLFAGGEVGTANIRARNGIAAIDRSTYELTDFNPNVNSSVYALALSSDSGTLYAGGTFTDVNNGTTRNRLAAFSTTDGIATAFDPNLSREVLAVELSADDSTLYAGGTFDQVNNGTADRALLASFNTSDGSVTDFDATPALSGEIHSIDLTDDESEIYVGGELDHVGDSTYKGGVASYLTSSGEMTGFNVGAFGGVKDVLLSGDGGTLYVAGSITKGVGGFSGEGIAFDLLGDPIEPNAHVFTAGGDGTIYTSISDGAGGWYIGGDFTHVNQTAWPWLAHITADGELDTDFDTDLAGSVTSLALSGDGETLYVGGGFTSVNGGTTRERVAAFDTTDGIATSFDPDLDGTVRSIILSPNEATLYVGGDFDTANNGSADRTRLAAFSTAATGTVTAFDPQISAPGGGVTALDISSDGSILYVGGTFIGGALGGPNADVVRNNAFGVTVADSVFTNFDPNLDGPAQAIKVVDDTTVYIGGSFTEVNGGTVRNALAAFDADDGVVTVFSPEVANGADPSIVYTLALSADGETLYTGGDIASAGGATRSNFAAFDVGTGNLTAFHPDFNRTVYTISTATDESTYIGGSFEGYGTVLRNGIFAVDLSDDSITDFDPDMGESTVNDIKLSSDDTVLYTVGTFTTIGGGAQAGIGSINTDDGTIGTFSPDAGDITGRAIGLPANETELYFSGDFTSAESAYDLGYFILFDDGSAIGGDDEEEPAPEEEDNDSGGSSGSHNKPIARSSGGFNLFALIAQLKQLLLELVLSGGTIPAGAEKYLEDASDSSNGSSDFIYTRNLTIGDIGDDVRALQLFLISQNKGPAAQALASNGATGYFGPLTQAALAEFQAAVGIVPAIGFFGPVTRAFIQEM